MKKVKPLLIGVVVDVSASMKKNWAPVGRRSVPRIELIRDALNTYFQKSSKISTNRTIDLFCLGFGFCLSQKYSTISVEDGNERVVENTEKTIKRADIVCDLLTLSEMVPTKTELEKLKNKLNSIWAAYADEIIGKTKTDNSVNQKLQLFIYQSLSETAKKNWRYALHSIYVKPAKGWLSEARNYLLSLMPVDLQNWDTIVEDLSEKEARRYFFDIYSKTEKLFDNKKQTYANFIYEALNDFANTEIQFILESQALGYPTKSIIKNFNKNKLFQQATFIFNDLEKEVNQSIKIAWAWNKAKLFKEKSFLGAEINAPAMKELTEQCIKNYGWGILKPFVEQQVYNIFIEAFENQAKQMIPKWVEYSSNREVIKSTRQIFAILPETSEKVIYSTEFMFGSSPMKEAIDKASMKFLNIKYKNREKVLILITDGEFEDSLPLKSADMLKKEGVTIVSCFVSSKNIIEKITSKINRSWSKGAKVLFEMSSNAEDNPTLNKLIESREIKVPDRAKLFYQINKPEYLNEIMEAIYNDY